VLSIVLGQMYASLCAVILRHDWWNTPYECSGFRPIIINRTRTSIWWGLGGAQSVLSWTLQSHRAPQLWAFSHLWWQMKTGRGDQKMCNCVRCWREAQLMSNHVMLQRHLHHHNEPLDLWLWLVTIKALIFLNYEAKFVQTLPLTVQQLEATWGPVWFLAGKITFTPPCAVTPIGISLKFYLLEAITLSVSLEFTLLDSLSM
jgi:hypothetical protein